MGKSILIIIVVLVVIISGSFLIYNYWWLPNFWLEKWDYRKEIVIDNSNSQYLLKNYSALLYVDTALLIKERKMLANCEDIRFTDSDKKTELSYWLEGGCNTEETKLWIKIPELLKNSEKKIYLYYGNPESKSTSDKVGATGIAAGEFTVKKVAEEETMRQISNCVRDSAGNFYCSFVLGDRTIYLVKSKDGGRNWEELLAETTKHGGGLSSIAIDSQDNIHMIWNDSELVRDPSDIKTTRLFNYFQYLRLSPEGKEEIRERFNDNINLQEPPFIAIDSKDNVHIIWSGLGRGQNKDTWNLQYQKRTSQGWGKIEPITDFAFQQTFPSIMIDSKDVIHIVWAGYDLKGKNRIIKYQKKDLHWAAPETVSEGFGNNIYPYLNLDINDNVHVVWYSNSTIEYRAKINQEWSLINMLDSGEVPLICSNWNKNLYLFDSYDRKKQLINYYSKQYAGAPWEEELPIKSSAYPYFTSTQGPVGFCMGVNWVKNNGFFNSMPQQGFALVYDSFTDSSRELKFYASENAVFGIAETLPNGYIHPEETTILNKIYLICTNQIKNQTEETKQIEGTERAEQEKNKEEEKGQETKEQSSEGESTIETPEMIYDISNWATYRNENYGIEIKIPKSLESSESENIISTDLPSYELLFLQTIFSSNNATGVPSFEINLFEKGDSTSTKNWFEKKLGNYGGESKEMQIGNYPAISWKPSGSQLKYYFIARDNYVYGFQPIVIEYKPDDEIVNKTMEAIVSTVKFLPINSSSNACVYKKGEYEKRLYDTMGRVSGKVNGVIKEEIPDAIVDENGNVVWFSPGDYFIFELFSIKSGNYQFNTYSPLDEMSFKATNIPILQGQTHRYVLNWGLMSKGIDGAILLTDNDGDNKFEKTMFITGFDLTCQDYLAQKNTTSTCTTSWQCTQWSACVNGKQSRSCNDISRCETSQNKPEELQSCAVISNDFPEIFSRIKSFLNNNLTSPLRLIASLLGGFDFISNKESQIFKNYFFIK